MKEENLIDSETTVYCSNPNCRTPLGNIISIENIDWLQMGGGIARQWHGVCAKCGREFHWSVSEIFLTKIIQSRLQKTK